MTTIVKVKGTTAGRRQMNVSTFEEVTAKKPLKSLCSSQKRCSGRNNQGRITIRHRGGGVKRHYRIIDFKCMDNKGVEGLVSTIEYDPNRNAYIILVYYKNGDKRYHLAPHGIKVGDKILTAERAKLRIGNRLQVKNIPVGFDIFNVELVSGKGGQIVRSAGNSAKLVSLEGARAQIQLPSSEVRFIPKDAYATIGIVSNVDISNLKIGKAGRNRWKGQRPEVRGKAMNPCDHPHGGGEGCCPVGMPHPKTPWGAPALGVKTRKRKNRNDIYRIRDRRGRNLIKTTLVI